MLHCLTHDLQSGGLTALKDNSFISYFIIRFLTIFKEVSPICLSRQAYRQRYKSLTLFYRKRLNVQSILLIIL